MAKKENTTSIGFEEIIWRAADKLRGNPSASESAHGDKSYYISY